MGAEGIKDMLSDFPDFPGKKPPKNRPENKELTPVEEIIATLRPTTFKVNGQLVDFYSIGQLAKALNRKAVTIRMWETRGFIPVAGFRTPAPKFDRPFGKTSPKGRRLYSRAQVEFLITAIREFVGDEPHSTDARWAAFKEYVKQHWPR